MSLDARSEERVTLKPSPENAEKPENPQAVAGRAGTVWALVKRESERTWQSYLTSAPLNLLFGLLGMFFLWLYLSPDTEASGERFWLDWLFLFVLVNIPVNWTSRGYWKTKSDPFQEHLDFLKTLPVSSGEIVAGRALVMAGSTAIMICVFFAPGYVIMPEMQEMLGPSQFFLFAVTWAGYSLVSGGIYLLLEFCVRSSRVRFWTMLIWVFPIAGTVLVCNFVLGVPLVAGSLTLIQRYGALPALVALVVSVVVFALLGTATARGIARRGAR